MRTIGTGVLVALALMAATASASNHIETNVFTIDVASRALAFTSPESEFAIRCPVSYAIDLTERRIPKTAGARIGTAEVIIDEARCRDGTVRVLRDEMPWNVNYVSFTGMLPTITGITAEIEEVELLVSAFAGLVRCLYRGNARFIFRNNPITVARADETGAMRLFRQLAGSMLCPRNLVRTGDLPIVAPEEGVRLRLV